MLAGDKRTLEAQRGQGRASREFTASFPHPNLPPQAGEGVDDRTRGLIRSCGSVVPLFVLCVQRARSPGDRSRQALCIELSEHTPMALKCLVEPKGCPDWPGGRYGTVNVAVPEMPSPSNMAVIVVLPVATAVADPLEAGALLTVATPELEELQVTWEVIPCVEASE